MAKKSLSVNCRTNNDKQKCKRVSLENCPLITPHQKYRRGQGFTKLNTGQEARACLYHFGQMKITKWEHKRQFLFTG